MSAHALTPAQRTVLDQIGGFLASDSDCFVLRGSAGTGKTTLIAAIAQLLASQQRAFLIGAPTGRAAKIIGVKTGIGASTIHSLIYALDRIEVIEEAQVANDPGIRITFPLKTSDPGSVVLIVDEASMVGDAATKQDTLQFGSGRLLSDLVEYLRLARVGRKGPSLAKVVFVGDPAQLPPVGESFSPALSVGFLSHAFGLRCEEQELTEVMRQRQGSSLLDRATAIRDQLAINSFNRFDLSPAEGEILESSTIEGVKKVAADYLDGSSSVLIAYSNARTRELNRGVRELLWKHSDAPMQVGDLLLVNKNSLRSGLHNGDLVRVLELRHPTERRQIAIRGVDKPVELVFHPLNIVRQDADGTQVSINCLALGNLLDSNARELSASEQRALLVDFRQRNPHLRPNSANFKLAIVEDPYFNALQVKYGYALTCHKSQGGEWDSAVVDFSSTGGKRNEAFFRWAYTAITRAKRCLMTIGAPQFDEFTGITWTGPTQASKELANADGRDVANSDPDWGRFQFSAGQEALFQNHLAVRDAWAAHGIVIVGLTHLQYCERYQLSREGLHCSLQYWYRQNQKLSRADLVGVAGGDADLGALAVRLLRGAIGSPGMAAEQSDNPFISEFINRTSARIAGSPVEIAGVERLQWRLRLEFRHDGKNSKIDFHYNAKQAWTRAEEVGGIGSSRGVMQMVQSLMGAP